MRCEACKGTGLNANNKPCAWCEGTGTMCDYCGESCAKGFNLCELCQQEEEENNQVMNENRGYDP